MYIVDVSSRFRSEKLGNAATELQMETLVPNRFVHCLALIALRMPLICYLGALNLGKVVL